MEKQLYDLIELARDLGTTTEDLIRYGADGELILYVIADEWPGKKTDKSGAKSVATVDGKVELLRTDLLKALNSDYTEIRQVKTPKGDVVELDSTQKVMRGVHFVTAAERDRMLEALKSAPQSTVEAFGDALPPYLDPEHQWYSEDLDAAVKAWMALYADGGFKKKSLGHKEQIESWLMKHRPHLRSVYARENIVTVVNPNKDGGNPKTRKN